MSPCLDPFVRCPLHRRLSLVSGLCQLRESASNLDTLLSLPSTPSPPSSSSRRLCFRIVVYVPARRLSTFASEIQHLRLFVSWIGILSAHSSCWIQLLALSVSLSSVNVSALCRSSCSSTCLSLLPPRPMSPVVASNLPSV